MEQPVQTRRMSRGCMAGLIVAGAIAVLLIIILVLVCVNRDFLIRWSINKTVTQMKTQLAQNPAPGVDTVRFDRLADTFLVRIRTAKVTDPGMERFAPAMQKLTMSKQFDSAKAYELSDAIIEYYPDLAPLGLREQSVPQDTTAAPPADSATRDTSAAR